LIGRIVDLKQDIAERGACGQADPEDLRHKEAPMDPVRLRPWFVVQPLRHGLIMFEQRHRPAAGGTSMR